MDNGKLAFIQDILR